MQILKIFSLFVLVLILFACEDKSPLVGSRQASLAIELIFNSPPFSSGQPTDANATKLGRSAHNAVIDRVTVSVIELDTEQTVISDQELAIVQINGQPFAEGNLIIPVEPPEQDFLIIVTAFEAQLLVARGEIEISLEPGQIEENPVVITMLQSPIVSNASQQLFELNSCDLGDGGDLASLFQVDFDYFDADGDVTSASVVTVNFTFVGGSSGSFTVSSPGISGDGFQGTITTGQCYRWGNNTDDVQVSMTLTDASGLTSAPIQLSIPKPSGGNLTVQHPGAGSSTP